MRYIYIKTINKILMLLCHNMFTKPDKHAEHRNQKLFKLPAKTAPEYALADHSSECLNFKKNSVDENF